MSEKKEQGKEMINEELYRGCLVWKCHGILHRICRCRNEYKKWGLFDSTLLCCFGWTENNEGARQPQLCQPEQIYRTVVVTEPSRDPSEYDEADLEFMCQRDISIDMGVDDVEETAIMGLDNVDVLDNGVNETADLEYEMKMYCQVDDAGDTFGNDYDAGGGGDDYY
ncbi:Oidioi.mRNA.OKI2018_I69.chr2.g4306.t1.cds [Oikopleura dioica]|uniref:Oidioi.mRNA.OKI2018_I69.chr2.g4306.t1.cds n=1 Tax=Oikopleura dioica TaxID=34765 RepID=A0ABN7T3D1_OIKDI|nr:Oidioi.mRNA.OKI2018_I69.chr2.g4306.t1.cds [Oikopleura dioica]